MAEKLSWKEKQEKVKEAIKSFPQTFELRNHKGLFRICPHSSYHNRESVQLVVQIQGESCWADFVRCEVGELRRQLK